MNPDVSPLQMLLVGAIVLVVLLWFGRGMGSLFRQSQEAPKDWTGLSLPLAAVVLFVALLMVMVSR